MKRWVPFEWIVAVRFLKEGRLQTIFILSGVAIGVGVIIFMSALLAGMQANFIKRVLTSQPQIALIVPDEVARPQRQSRPGLVVAATVERPAQRIRSIDQWQKTRDELQHWSGVINVAPIMTMSALAVRRGQPLRHADRRRPGRLLQNHHDSRLHRRRAAATDRRRHPDRH
jgi:lipoprotein-releasing system permease protein